MPLEPHRIRRLRWRVRTRSETDAFVLRSGLRAQMETVLVPSIARVLDEAATGDRWVALERIDLDLRIASAKELDTLLPGLIRELLGKRLRAVLPHTVNSTTESPPDASPAPQILHLQTLLHYLATGSLDWPAASMDRWELRRRLGEVAAREFQTVLNQSPSDATPPSSAVAFFARFLQLLPPDRWSALADSAVSALPLALRTDFTAAIHAVADSTANERSASTHAAAALLAATRATSDEERRRRIECVVSLDATGRAHSTTRLPHGAERALVHCVGTWFGRAAPCSSPTPTGGSPPRAEDPQRESQERPKLSSPQKPKDGQAPPPQTRATWSQPSPEPAGDPFALAVHHAGLILLNPFLPRFLETAGVLRPDRSLDPHQLARAAALLALLATGDNQYFEFEIAFIKVLLGTCPDTPLPTGGEPLTEADRREVDDLLEAVIAHWRVLQHTSLEGLRTAFLQRRGLLYDEDVGWRLRVEPRSFDVLLDRLPWTLSVVVMPWMSKPIFTEWMPR